ncbi:sensor histidine kinase [Desulfosediminicola ganghwensis]|uniref:sensor histidine kinase n=1 Tax=Desulfosediminicola ganghwensis TaxID=2569540 RepID=UPI001592C29E|nr:ATP-binding protein [Desulfosediminicola ganghwensis]
MKSIYWKIFLWFWLSMMGVGILFVSSSFFLESDSLLSKGRENALRSLDRVGNLSVTLFEQNKIRALDRLASRVEETNGFVLYLFSGDGQHLYGDRLPQNANRIINRVLDKEGPAFLVFGSRPLVAKPITSNNDKQFIIAAALPKRWINEPLNPSYYSSVRLWITIVTSAVVCLILAKHISKPITILTKSTRKFAGGKFDERVLPLIGRRRDEFYDLAAGFDEMAGRTEKLISSREELLRNISHELRSPLSRMTLALDLARKKGTPEVETALQRVDKEIVKMNYLIGQVITLSQIEAIHSPVKQDPIDLEELIQKIQKDAELEASSRNCFVEVTKTEKISIAGDYDLIYSAVENLVRNAIRFTNESTAVEISLKTEPLLAEKKAVIAIRDHGPGVNDNDLDKLFLPFFQAGTELRTTKRNSGLGLAITLGAVEQHGGKVTARNKDDGGLEVSITLPYIGEHKD